MRRLLPCQAMRHDVEDDRIENHSDVRSRNLEVHIGISGSADLPVYDAVRFGVYSGLAYRSREFVLERLQEPAGASGGVAGWQHVFAVAVEDPPPYGLATRNTLGCAASP